MTKNTMTDTEKIKKIQNAFDKFKLQFDKIKKKHDKEIAKVIARIEQREIDRIRQELTK